MIAPFLKEVGMDRQGHVLVVRKRKAEQGEAL